MFRDGLGDILLGDLNQPRGGPMSSGHKSHQIGLDADVYFRTLPSGTKNLSPKERQGTTIYSLVKADGTGVDLNRYKSDHAEFLKRATSLRGVARIFVHAHIKKHLCQLYPGAENETWLQKLRPWWGHDSHFHLRLECPLQNPDCQEQDAVPAGNGCSEVDSWIGADGKIQPLPPPSPGATGPVLPQRCAEVLNAR
jgi:penicillin-insensitive murein endopeptidase